MIEYPYTDRACDTPGLVEQTVEDQLPACQQFDTFGNQLALSFT